MKQAVSRGAAVGPKEAVEEAVVARLRELRRAKVYAVDRQAARDPHFMVDMEETTAVFDAVLPDGLSEP